MQDARQGKTRRRIISFLTEHIKKNSIVIILIPRKILQ